MIHEKDNGYMISSRKVWLPGVYNSRKAANYAFRFTDAELQKLQDKVNPDGVITFEMLQQLKRQLKTGE